MVADQGGQIAAVLPLYGRKLIAVVFADMAGYSRLIGLDDAGTFERLQELRRDLIDPALQQHGGTLVNTAGDSLLVTFDSIIPAMRFAVDVQRGVPDFDGDYAPDRRIRFRMGVNVGDVIPDGTNLHGEGVNIAARLQAICPPGAICVSRVVRDHVGNRLGRDFKELGPIDLKNIARPIEAFLLELTPSARVAGTSRSGHSGMTLVCAVVVFLAGLGVYEYRSGNLAPATETQPVPPRLSIAVLPFSTFDGSPEFSRLADGITEDLTTDLTKFSEAPVSPRQGVVRFKGQPINARAIGSELNVRYILTGSLRRLGDGIRANVVLISTETGAALWADQLDAGMPDVASDQDEIAGWLRNSVHYHLAIIEGARSARERPDHPDALDLLLQARAVFWSPPSLTRETKARALYEGALRLDPGSVPAMVGVASTIIGTVVSLGGDISATDYDRAQQLVAAAEALAPTDVKVMWARAFLARFQQQWPEAEAGFERVLRAYPHYDGAGTMLGICEVQLGRSEEAISVFQKAIRTDPHSLSIWAIYIRLGQAFLLTGRYGEAINWLQRSLAAAPEQSAATQRNAHMMMASAYALSGQIRRAQEEVVAVSALAPFATVRGFWAGYVANETFSVQIEKVREGLRMAGLRDHAEEGENVGIAADTGLATRLGGRTPLTVPGAATIRTTDLAAFLRDGKPLIIDASEGNETLSGALNVPEAGLGGTFHDALQDRLRHWIRMRTKGDMSGPIVTLGLSAERWNGYNLALRLVELGYRQVYWYRGGREAWAGAGLPVNRTQQIKLTSQ